ncbi:condensation domain-containing protein [Flavitalea sp.]|nr:condensation domain-containing protein [Flavitalea sp.]
MSDFQERINRLSRQQMLLLARQIGADNTTNTSGQSNSTQCIAAYLVADGPIETNDLRQGLKDKLPEYMIPSKFVQLDELPRLPNGKIDLNSLKLPVEEKSSFSKTGVSTPKTKVEIQLVEIWEEVLGFRPIGVHDNFFEIGGDSILSIQIVAKARQKEIFLAPNQMFENQTISELALFAKTENRNITEEKIVGNVPLLPIQHWFFEEHKNAPHHWNQAMIFDVPGNLNTDILQKSIEYLVKHHDALRLRFEKTEGSWDAFVTKHPEVNAFSSIDLTGSSTLEMDSTIEAKSAELQTNQDLSKSGLFKTLFVKCGLGYQSKMLLIAHHLVVDNISWQILVSDLESIYVQLSRDEEIVLFSKTTSYPKWGNHLIELSKSSGFDDEIEFWKEQNYSGQIPTDIDSHLPIVEKSIKTLALEIDSAATEKLLRNSNEAYHTKTEELLIAALMLGFEKWANIKSLCLGLEKHGRKYNEVDLTNTVGWFTTYFPVSLKIEDGTSLKSSIISIKEKLRSIPNEGIGFGVLRYLKKLDGLTQKPQVIFNFLGNQTLYDSDVLGKGKFISKGVRSPRSERHHLLEINAFIQEGRLNLLFSFSEEFHKPEAIQNLVGLFESTLRRLIEHCSSQEASEYSPSDFPEADLSQDDFDTLLNQIN